MTASDQHDAALVAAARRADSGAFTVLVERHYPPVLRACIRATRDTDLAADAAQEAVLTALVSLGRLRHDERFGAWLIGIGLNLCRRRLREAARRSAEPAPDRAAQEPGPHERAQAAEAVAHVRAAVAALPRGQRDATAPEARTRATCSRCSTSRRAWATAATSPARSRSPPAC